MSTKPKPHLPVVAATTEAEEAQAVAEDLRVKAAALDAEAAEAQRVANVAAMERTRLELERRDRLNEATIAVATAEIAKANEAAEIALSDFRSAIADEPWMIALVEHLSAKLASRSWATRLDGARLQLRGDSDTQASVNVWTPEPVIALDAMVAGIVSALATDARAAHDRAVARHHDDYIAGRLDDATPPTTTL